MKKSLLTLLPTALVAIVPGFGQAANQNPSPQAQIDQQTLDKLLQRLSLDEARIKELEQKLTAPPAVAALAATNPGSAPTAAQPEIATAEIKKAEPPAAKTDPAPETDAMNGMGNGHTMEMPGGGPNLTVRGYLDFDFGAGSLANPLLFTNGVGSRSGFQVGEFTLMASSQLSEKLSFMSELVVGSDYTNAFGVDLERYMLTYKASKYFEASAGRYHTSIGYYNTAYHHGTWFQTATGRPIMYYFEDSGGLLPVHNVGVSLTGLVPGTDKLGLHWVAELGNGRASDRNAAQVQNFYSDRNHRAFNFATYINPSWARGLQIGGSYYLDRLAPPGLNPVDQRIGSFYTVYLTPSWEFLNEGVLLTNHLDNGGRTFNTPLAYTQLSHKFGAWRPYFRYQYIHSPAGDPVNLYTGRYMGPSLGLRYDFADYAAFKVQYNMLNEHDHATANGLDAQVAFTF